MLQGAQRQPGTRLTWRMGVWCCGAVVAPDWWKCLWLAHLLLCVVVPPRLIAFAPLAPSNVSSMGGRWLLPSSSSLLRPALLLPHLRPGLTHTLRCPSTPTLNPKHYPPPPRCLKDGILECAMEGKRSDRLQVLRLAFPGPTPAEVEAALALAVEAFCSGGRSPALQPPPPAVQAPLAKRQRMAVGGGVGASAAVPGPAAAAAGAVAASAAAPAPAAAPAGGGGGGLILEVFEDKCGAAPPPSSQQHQAAPEAGVAGPSTTASREAEAGSAAAAAAAAAAPAAAAAAAPAPAKRTKAQLRQLHMARYLGVAVEHLEAMTGGRLGGGGQSLLGCIWWLDAQGQCLLGCGRPVGSTLVCAIEAAAATAAAVGTPRPPPHLHAPASLESGYAGGIRCLPAWTCLLLQGLSCCWHPTISSRPAGLP